MDSIVKRLINNHRVDEVDKRTALNTLARDLDAKLSKIKGYTHHRLQITPDYKEGRVLVNFEGTDDEFAVYPRRDLGRNPNSNKTEKVSNINGAYIVGTKVYDSAGKFLGEALVRIPATHNKSDYSDSLTNAEFRFNSKVVDLQRLEKYIAREAIINMEDKHKNK